MSNILSGVARQAKAILFYQGINITTQVFPQLVEVTYTDRITGKEDTVEIELADPDHRFQTVWTFARAQPISLTLEQDSWNSAGEILQQECGTFEIDKVHMEGPPSRVILSCKSIAVSGSLKRQQKSRAWEGASLQSIAQQIAGENHMTLNYQPDTNPTFSRVDQREQSDMVVLQRECERQGFVLKVPNSTTMVIADEKALESQAPTFTIVCPTVGNPGGINNAGILKWSLIADSNEVVNQAIVSYHNPETGRTVKQTFTPTASPTSAVSGVTDIDSSRLDITQQDTAQGDN